MGLFDGWRKEKKHVVAPVPEPVVAEKSQGTAKVEFVGGDVHVNPDAPTRQKRNVARINRLKSRMQEMIAKGQQDTKQYDNLKTELDFRLMQIKMDEIKGGN
jgi:hypothetical protein